MLNDSAFFSKKSLFGFDKSKQFKCLILLWSGYPSKLFQGSAFFILYSLYELPVLEGNRRKIYARVYSFKDIKILFMKIDFPTMGAVWMLGDWAVL